MGLDTSGSERFPVMMVEVILREEPSIPGMERPHEILAFGTFFPKATVHGRGRNVVDDGSLVDEEQDGFSVDRFWHVFHSLDG